MSMNVRSGVVGGLLSAVIWMMIATAVGLGRAPVIVGGLLCLVGTGAITIAIATMVGRRVAAGRS
ncbi:vacuolar-type H+-ATPase subunit I/STV1 [Friedmanniella endophytica]|uniref:Vacuolar-type H+-ATPase subunit I/STV1 n=1 Tax=Microlunatus kandeliicorticis TaxID=1759536 RepID=A0A7W3P690_9ACTN|nr:hypothetical protein [Microlunatus kandeliicorticis]MBA8794712.1 vacuolar-type H+-ATPase subunit I/STV1 [Microlunatus kandeliicorticis]